jgi:hypothetical protein
MKNRQNLKSSKINIVKNKIVKIKNCHNQNRRKRSKSRIVKNLQKMGKPVKIQESRIVKIKNRQKSNIDHQQPAYQIGDHICDLVAAAGSAYCLGSGNADKARLTAKRAIETINYRLESLNMIIYAQQLQVRITNDIAQLDILRARAVITSL